MSLKGEQQLRDILSIVGSMIGERMQLSGQVGIEGVISPGSADPANADASMIRGDTAASLDEGSNLTPRKLALATTQIGDQWTPGGGERCVALHTQSGAILIFEHGSDDAPAPPAGWRYIGSLNGLRLSTVGGLVMQIDDTSGFAQIGATGLDATQDAAASQRYVQQAINDLRTQVQTAFTQLASEVQGGSGVGAPTVGSVTVHGSAKVKIAP